MMATERPSDPTGLFELIGTQTLPESKDLNGKIISKPGRQETYRNKDYPQNQLKIALYDDGSIIISASYPGIFNVTKPLEQVLRFVDRYYQDHPSDNFHLVFDKKFIEQMMFDAYIDFQQNFRTALTRRGFLPKPILDAEGYDHLIIKAYDQPDTITYGLGESLFEHLDYQKFTPEQLRARNEEKPRTALIYLYYGRNPAEIAKFIYPRSKRPRTQMNLLEGLQRRENPASLKLSVFSESPVTLYSSGDQRYIPITRYGAGMRRGQFRFDEDETSDQRSPDQTGQDWCGTFYYYEPDSNFFLSVAKDRYLIFDNKYTATKWLYSAMVQGRFLQRRHDVADLLQTPEDANSLYMSLGSRGQYRDAEKIKNLRAEMDSEMQDFLLVINDILPTMGAHGATITPEFIASMKSDHQIDLADAFMSNVEIETPDGKNLLQTSNDFLLPNGSVAPYIEKFYSQEDVFDQPLCQASRYLNFDVIILMKMVGSGRTVTEVLDTRDRNTSFKSIYEIIS